MIGRDLSNVCLSLTPALPLGEGVFFGRHECNRGGLCGRMHRHGASDRALSLSQRERVRVREQAHSQRTDVSELICHSNRARQR